MMLSKTQTRVLMQSMHTDRVDMLSACEAFVSITDRGSFTRGAAWVGISQSVASRRIAALEHRVGGRVLERSGRAPTLTRLGEQLIPTARRMVETAEAFMLAVDEANLSAVDIAIPQGCDVRDQAAIELAGRDTGLNVALTEAAPHARRALLSSRRVAAAVLTKPGSDATWRIPLGVAGALARTGRVHLDHLRPVRAEGHGRAARVWLLPEDDVPHVRDPLVAAAQAAGMAPAQVAVAPSMSAALASVLGSSDLLVAAQHEATRLDLAWMPLAAPDLYRGYSLVAASSSEAERLRTDVGGALGRALGAPDRREQA